MSRFIHVLARSECASHDVLDEILARDLGFVHDAHFGFDSSFAFYETSRESVYDIVEYESLATR